MYFYINMATQTRALKNNIRKDYINFTYILLIHWSS